MKQSKPLRIEPAPFPSEPSRMLRKKWMLPALLAILAGGYVYRYTDWLVPPRIQIDVTTRPSGRVGPDAKVLPVIFMLDRECALASLRVVAVSNVPPAQLGKPVWEFRRESKGEDVRAFEYGEVFRGTKATTPPQPLTPGAVYRMELRSGRMRGERDFTARAPGEPVLEQ